MARKIRYVGPSDEIEVPSLHLTVQRNHQVEVTNEQAAELLRQDVWEAVESAPRKADDKPAAEPKEADK